MVAILTLYMLGLFAVAASVDRRGDWGWSRKLAYPFSLAVYCSAWKYFGGPGTAARTGWDFIPIYIGPIIGITVFFPFWRKISAAVQRENSGSLADLLSSRYGKSEALGGWVALICTIGLLPSIALQLKSVLIGWRVFHGEPALGPQGWPVFLVAGLLSIFAILFGARRADLSERNRGLAHAIAVESVIKLAVVLLVAGSAVVALFGLGSVGDYSFTASPLAKLPEIDTYFVVITLLSGLSIFCLPRQFHLAFVERVDGDNQHSVRWMFPLYLAAMGLSIIPIAMAGSVLAPSGDPDFLILDVARTHGVNWLPSLAFLAGVSAATAMVVAETVALSAMVSNHLVLPLLGGIKGRDLPSADLSRLIVLVRRAAICTILFLASIYALSLNQAHSLAEDGLTSCVAVAQLAPALIGGLYWRGGNARGALAGLLAGSGIWFCLLMAPKLASLLFVLPTSALMDSKDLLVLTTILSLGVNTCLYVCLSLRSNVRLIDQIQANAFMATSTAVPGRQIFAALTVGDLETLVARFVGSRGAQRGFEAFETSVGRPMTRDEPATAGLIRAAERMVGGAIGAASSRSVMASALAAKGNPHHEAIRLLDHAAQAVQFSREVLESTLDSIDQGVGVVDKDLRLLAWNSRYLEMFDLPADFLYVGQPVAEIIRYEASRFTSDQRALDDLVRRRTAIVQQGVPYKSERTRPDGRIYKIVGAPMPGGGYVASYTDITELRQTAAALSAANETLEARVEERTRELREAKKVAESAMASKSRFIAAASHDLLQPLHAARLFIGALGASEIAPESAKLVTDADRCIGAANRLLRALLNLSRLEVGGVKPEVSTFAATELLADLRDEFTGLAREKGLELRFTPTRLWLVSDRDLLRSVLQNLLANALTHSHSGRVLAGCRRCGPNVRIEVWDTGPGIAAEHIGQITEEFVRLPNAQTSEGGMGLGLAIVRRVCDILGHRLQIDSQLGRGSRFSVLVPRGRSSPAPRHAKHEIRSLAGMRICCIDDDPVILESLSILLTTWGVKVSAATGLDGLTEDGPWDVVLVDYNLGQSGNGLDVIERLKGRARVFALVTGDLDEHLPRRAQELGAALMDKPLDPATLKAFLASVGLSGKLSSASQEHLT